LKRRVILPPEIQSELRNFPPQTKRYIRQALREIEINPKGGKQLQDELSGFYSLTVKRFRIIYEIKEEIILVLGVGPRKSIYDKMITKILPK